MLRTAVFKILPVLVVIFSFPVLALAQTSTDPSLAYANRKNRVPQLSDKDRKYFDKQYQTKCSRCHGKEGNGKGNKSGDGPRAADFTDAKFMGTLTDGQVFYQIEKGGEENSAMPAFGPGSSHGWSEEKIWKMVRYIRLFAR